MTEILRVRLASRGWVGAPGLNTFYFHKPDPNSQTDLAIAQLCADRVHAAFAAITNTLPQAWRGVVDPNVDFLEDTTGELQSTQSVTPPTEISGIAVSGWQAIVAMLLVQLRTDTILDGHRLRGRAFIGPVAEQQDTDGTPNADQHVKMGLFGDALLSVGLNGPTLCVWHRPRKADATATPPVTARAGGSGDVTTITSPDKYAVLRSRRD